MIVLAVLGACSQTPVNLAGGVLAGKVKPTVAPVSRRFYVPSIRGQVVALDTLQPIAAAEVSHGNFPAVVAYADPLGVFELEGTSGNEVRLFLPAAGRQFQPLLVRSLGYERRIIWLPVFLAEHSRRREQAGFIFLDAHPEQWVESMDELALADVDIQRGINGCDREAWRYALALTRSARKLAVHLDGMMPVASYLSGQQQLMLVDSYQHMETAWQLVWSSCRFQSEQERRQAESIFDQLNREAQSMREALQLVDVKF